MSLIKNYIFDNNYLKVLSDEKARNYSDGVAFHYYMGGLAPPNLMTQIHKKYPEQILLGTEASEGKYYDKN